MSVHHAKCLTCGHESTIDFSPLNWPTCPNCNAPRTKLIKMEGVDFI